LPTDVGSREETDSVAEAVALLEQLIKKNNEDSCHAELQHDECAVDNAKILIGSVHARENAQKCHHQGDEEREELLGSLEELAVVFAAKLDWHVLGACKGVQDHRRDEDGRDTLLHKGTPFRRKNNAHLVQGVHPVKALDAVQG